MLVKMPTSKVNHPLSSSPRLQKTQNVFCLFSKVAAMFGEWEQLVVRLDVWHLMQRFTRGFNTDCRQLYDPFMTQLSIAIFEWDSCDLHRLEEAKRSKKGRDAHVQLTSKELSSHCRRRTRGALETERLIQELLDSFSVATDVMGIPLIDRAKMEVVWSTQRRHLHCIQDPPGVELYVKTGEVTKWGVKLPVFRCARGTTSLESFHRHMSRFLVCECEMRTPEAQLTSVFSVCVCN